jgi:hypothetical protein
MLLGLTAGAVRRELRDDRHEHLQGPWGVIRRSYAAAPKHKESC